jgi:hypothetical protein
MERLLGNPDLARQMGASRHLEDREYFLPKNTAGSFLRIYHELLNE